VVQGLGRQAGAGEQAADAAVGAGDVGVGAVVDVQQGGLCPSNRMDSPPCQAFHRYSWALPMSGSRGWDMPDQVRSDGLQGREGAGSAQQDLHFSYPSWIRSARVWGGAGPHADTLAGRLHLVGGADAAPVVPILTLPPSRHWSRRCGGQDDVGPVGDEQPAAQVEPAAAQVLHSFRNTSRFRTTPDPPPGSIRGGGRRWGPGAGRCSGR